MRPWCAPCDCAMGIFEFRPYDCSAVHGSEQINAANDDDDVCFTRMWYRVRYSAGLKNFF